MPKARPVPTTPHQNPPKAYENMEFLHSHYARHIRVMCEFVEPQHRLQKHGIRNTIVFFGSARTLPADKAKANLAKAKEDAKKLPTKEAKKLIQKAESAVEASAYYEAARQLASGITKWSKDLHRKDRRFYVCSGGGPGIMEAANRGASEAGGMTLGLGISLPYEQTNNHYISEDLEFEFHYFFIRKYWFFYLAKAMIIFPGGFGTMDELFELLTLIQTKKTQKTIPIVLFGSKFWNELLNFEAFRKWGMIDDEDLELFHITDSVKDAQDYVTKRMTELYVNVKGNGYGAHA
ncbi:MAG: LOG family protein [Puniceicoccales bacterium]|jgi:uncharacterized protein (TIGR00730 family)|nr:LOG family protein [Puniceicoccales bacterium]